MKKPVTVMLEHDEVALAWDIARIRQDSKKFVHPTKGGMNLAHTPKGVHWMGALAEIAAAKVMGGDLNMDAYAWGGDKHEPDFIDRWGRKIEAKGSTYKGPDCEMKLEMDELILDRHYCHCLLTLPDRVDVYPTVAGPLIEKYHYIRNYGYGDRIAIKAETLLKIANSEEGIREASGLAA